MDLTLLLKVVLFYFWIVTPYYVDGYESSGHANLASCNESKILYQAEGETVSECYAR